MLLLLVDKDDIAVSIVSLNPLSPSHVEQGVWSRKVTRLGMVLRAQEPNSIQEPLIIESQLVPLGHLLSPAANPWDLGLKSFACTLWQKRGPPN